MSSMQLYFEELENKLFVSKLCETCKNKCKVYCLSKRADIFCYRYKKD